MKEFANLSTPVIETTLDKNRAVVSRPLFESIWAYFTITPKWMPAAALAVIAIFAGLFWFSAISSGDEKIAENKEETLKETASSRSEQTVRSDSMTMNFNKDNLGANRWQVKIPNEVKSDQAQNGSSPARNIDQTPVNNLPPAKIKKSAFARAEKITNKKDYRLINKINVPTLLIEDEEDNSLRLADIFEEVSLK